MLSIANPVFLSLKCGFLGLKSSLYALVGVMCAGEPSDLFSYHAVFISNATVYNSISGSLTIQKLIETPTDSNEYLKAPKQSVNLRYNCSKFDMFMPIFQYPMKF